MEIILLERIRNLGDLGEIVQVKNGYARNFLLPQKKAMLATDDAKAEVERRRIQLAAEEGKRIDGAQARADLTVKQITLPRLCSAEGKLYGSVSPADVASALSAAATSIEKSEVSLPDGPIKQLGEFTAEVILHAEVRFAVQVSVVAEQSDKQSDKPKAKSKEDATEGLSGE